MSDHYWLFARTEDGETPNAHEAEEYHDFIQEMMASEFWQELPPATQQAMLVARDTLCWALGHSDNPSFANNIRMWGESFDEYTGRRPSYPN